MRTFAAASGMRTSCAVRDTLRRMFVRSTTAAYVENGTPHPFEVWVNGSEQPRGLGALAKTLSMDMRANDRAWRKGAAG